MSLQIQIAPRREFPSKALWEMHKLRAKVFKGRMGWEVPIMSGMEIDGYDAIEPYYMLMRDADGLLRGCWRLLPTQGPYMLKDSFPQLLHGMVAPEHPKIWELSRFAIETEGCGSFGFSQLTLEAIRDVISFGHRTSLEQYVTVTTTAIERLLHRTGVVVERVGQPLRIGVENAVALYWDVEKSHEILSGLLPRAA